MYETRENGLVVLDVDIGETVAPEDLRRLGVIMAEVGEEKLVVRCVHEGRRAAFALATETLAADQVRESCVSVAKMLESAGADVALCRDGRFVILGLGEGALGTYP